MTWRDEYNVHPAADVFPMQSNEELDGLAADIKANGLKEPIILWVHPKDWKMSTRVRDGHIQECDSYLLDGRNRMEAMQRAGIEVTDCMCRIVAVEDPAAFVISANIDRRHLTKEQRADLIVKACAAAVVGPTAVIVRQDGEKRKRGRPTKEAKAKAAEIAKGLDISERTVERAFAKHEGRTPKVDPEREARVKRRIERRQAEADKHLLEKNDHQVKDLLDAIKVFKEALEVATKSVSKFSPEAVSFTARWLDKISAAIAVFNGSTDDFDEDDEVSDEGDSEEVIRRRAWLNAAKMSWAYADTFLVSDDNRAIAKADPSEIDREVMAAAREAMWAWEQVCRVLVEKQASTLVADGRNDGALGHSVSADKGAA